MNRLFDLAAWAEGRLRDRRVVAVLVVALAVHCGVIASQRMGDFHLYHQAAERLLAGEPIYQLDDPHRYLYAPIVTFLFVPLAPLHWFPAAVIWYALTIALVVHSLRLAERLVYAGGRAPPGFAILVLLPVLRFVDNNLGHGQINVLLLWLVLFAYDQATRRRAALAGFALAGAVYTKFFPLALLLQIFLARRWRFLAASGGALVVLLLAPLAWWGDAYPDVLGDWIAVLRSQAGHYDTANKINQSISAFTHRLVLPHDGGTPLVPLGPGAAFAFGLAVHGLFLAALVRHSLARRDAETPVAGRDAEELALYLLYATVAAPYSWKYYFIDLLLPTAVVFRRASEGRQVGGAAVLVVVFLLNLLPGLRVFGKEAATQFQLWSFHFWAVVVLFVAIAWPPRAREVSTNEPGC